MGRPTGQVWIFVVLASALVQTAAFAAPVEAGDEELEPLPDLLRDNPTDLPPGQRALEPPREPLTPEEEDQLQLLKTRAQSGDHDEQYRLGRRYATGRGAPRDLRQAVFWYEKAAAHGMVEAFNSLSSIYAAGGRGIERDPKKARDYLRRAAAKKFAPALFNLGQQYRSGDLFERNDALAFRYFKEAADAGLAEAQTNLGVMYMEGTGTPADPRAAVEAWRKAEKGDNPRARYYLGVAYWRGVGVEKKDPDKAVEYLRQAAARDFHPARKFLEANGK